MDDANICMLRQLLIDSLPLLCRNGLPKDTAFRVDAMVGITIGTQTSSTLICISESVSNTGLPISGKFGSKKENISTTKIKQETSDEPYYIEADDDCSLIADSLDNNKHSSVNSSQHLPKPKSRKKKQRTENMAKNECDNIESFKEEQRMFNNDYVEDSDVKQEPASSEYYDEASYEAIEMGEAGEGWDEESWAQNNWYDESTGEPSNLINIGKMQGYNKRNNSGKKIQRNSMGSQKTSLNFNYDENPIGVPETIEQRRRRLNRERQRRCRLKRNMKLFMMSKGYQLSKLDIFEQNSFVMPTSRSLQDLRFTRKASKYKDIRNSYYHSCLNNGSIAYMPDLDNAYNNTK